MSSERINILITVAVSIVIPMLTLYFNSKKNLWTKVQQDKNTDLNALREVKEGLDTIKTQNNEMNNLSMELIEKKQTINNLKTSYGQIQLDLEQTKQENLELRSTVETLKQRVDALSKLLSEYTKKGGV